MPSSRHTIYFACRFLTVCVAHKDMIYLFVDWDVVLGCCPLTYGIVCMIALLLLLCLISVIIFESKFSTLHSFIIIILIQIFLLSVYMVVAIAWSLESSDTSDRFWKEAIHAAAKAPDPHNFTPPPPSERQQNSIDQSDETAWYNRRPVNREEGY